MAVSYLGENGEMSCLSLAQLMLGGGTLWTSHGKTASSPSITDILTGSFEPSAPSALNLGRTDRTNMAIRHSHLYIIYLIFMFSAMAKGYILLMSSF